MSDNTVIINNQEININNQKTNINNQEINEMLAEIVRCHNPNDCSPYSYGVTIEKGNIICCCKFCCLAKERGL